MNEMNDLVLSNIGDPDFEGDLYEILGVTPDATPEQITLAYRRLARRYHPDRASSFVLPGARDRLISRFHAISKAYAVLNNKDSRAFYDDTGILPLSEEELIAKAHKEADSMLLMTCSELCNIKDIKDLRRINPVEVATKAVELEAKNLDIGQHNAGLMVKKMTMMIGKFRKKNQSFDATVVGSDLADQVKKLKASRGQQLNRIKILRRAQELLRRHEYEVDPDEVKQRPSAPRFESATFPGSFPRPAVKFELE